MLELILLIILLVFFIVIGIRQYYVGQSTI